MGLSEYADSTATMDTMHDELRQSANACTQVLKANESFSQGFDKPMGLGVKKKVRRQGAGPFKTNFNTSVGRLHIISSVHSNRQSSQPDSGVQGAMAAATCGPYVRRCGML